jgi:hypothetical protein
MGELPSDCKHCYYLRTMSTEQILALLVAERERIDNAIAALGGSSKGTAGARVTATGRVRTAEQRQAQSEKMKQYWASRKAEGSAKKNKKKV